MNVFLALKASRSSIWHIHVPSRVPGWALAHPRGVGELKSFISSKRRKMFYIRLWIPNYLATDAHIRGNCLDERRRNSDTNSPAGHRKRVLGLADETYPFEVTYEEVEGRLYFRHIGATLGFDDIYAWKIVNMFGVVFKVMLNSQETIFIRHKTSTLLRPLGCQNLIFIWRVCLHFCSNCSVLGNDC